MLSRSTVTPVFPVSPCWCALSTLFWCALSTFSFLLVSPFLCLQFFRTWISYCNTMNDIATQCQTMHHTASSRQTRNEARQDLRALTVLMSLDLYTCQSNFWATLHWAAAFSSAIVVYIDSSSVWWKPIWCGRSPRELRVMSEWSTELEGGINSSQKRARRQFQSSP